MINFARFLAKESKYLYHTDLRSVLMWVHDLFVKAEELKRPRDPRPLLKSYPGYRSRYRFASLQMALMSKEGQIISTPTHCRDFFNETIRCYVTDGKTACGYSHKALIKKFDRDSLRFVCLSDTSTVFIQPVYDGIKNGLRLANMYGRVAGWKDFQLVRCLLPAPAEEPAPTHKGLRNPMRIRKVAPPRECYVIIGDKNWQRTPQFISLLILLIRVCLVHKVPDWVTDAYSLQGYWWEMLFTDNYVSSTLQDFNNFLYNSYDKLLTLVAHEREIFPHDIDGGYDVGIDDFHLKSGLNSLIQMNSTHPESAGKLHTLYTEVLKNDAQSKGNISL